MLLLPQQQILLRSTPKKELISRGLCANIHLDDSGESGKKGYADSSAPSYYPKLPDLEVEYR